MKRIVFCCRFRNAMALDVKILVGIICALHPAPPSPLHTLLLLHFPPIQLFHCRRLSELRTGKTSNCFFLNKGAKGRGYKHMALSHNIRSFFRKRQYQIVFLIQVSLCGFKAAYPNPLSNAIFRKSNIPPLPWLRPAIPLSPLVNNFTHSLTHSLSCCFCCF